MGVDEKLNQIVQAGTALCAGLANLGGVDTGGDCGFRLASRFHGITPEFSENLVQVAVRKGRVEITSRATGGAPGSMTLRVIDDEPANSLQPSITSALLRVTSGDLAYISRDTMVEWTLDQLLPASRSSIGAPGCTGVDPTFTGVWSLTAQPQIDSAAQALSLQVCCITGDCAISQIQCLISFAASQRESTEIRTHLANGRTGQLVVALAKREANAASVRLIDAPVRTSAVSLKTPAYA
ncbi:MAG: hypothetical protein HKL95_06740 [Phycisphaerae bacterium]|nr:hypothetical protein [Phycisphaerae bacterium]